MQLHWISKRECKRAILTTTLIVNQIHTQETTEELDSESSKLAFFLAPQKMESHHLQIYRAQIKSLR